jgi:hypothetical protein
MVVEQKRHKHVDLKSKVKMLISEWTGRDRRVFRDALERDVQQKERNLQSGTDSRLRTWFWA